MSHVVRTGPYSVFGTAASPKTLTASYVADTKAVQLADSLRGCMLEVSFTPGTTGEFCEVLIETSMDQGFGSPTTFYAFSEENFPDAAPVATYLGVEGIPYRFPADIATPTGSTTYTRSYLIGDLRGAVWVRVSARSSGSSGFGTAFIRIRFAE